MTAAAAGVPMPRTPQSTRTHRLQRVLAAAQRIGHLLGTVLIVLAGLILLAMTVGPRAFHYQTATMLTGSMAPHIVPGDVVLDVREKATDIRVGQIITYHIPVDDHRVESHRITWIGHTKTGAISFRTKGDANQGEDPWTATTPAASNVWRVRAVVPVAGDVIRLLRQPIVRLLLTRVIPIVAVVWLLLSIWRRPTATVATSTDTPTVTSHGTATGSPPAKTGPRHRA